MRKGTCASCGISSALGQMRLIEQKTYCPQCVDKIAGSSMQGRGYEIIDPTVCYECKTDWGNIELKKVGKLPCCETCREKFYHYPFPKWLQIALAVSCLLLVVALAHGAKYFKMARMLYRGEHLISAGHSEEAVNVLRPVAVAAPDCDKCVLLLAKAYLLSGDPFAANKAAMGHKNGHFEQSDLLDEVNRLNRGTGEFVRLLQQAGKQEQSNQMAEARKSLQMARAAYPYWKGFDTFSRQIDIGEAFGQHDWDKFLKLAQEDLSRAPNSSEPAAEVASALAAKWAATGDPRYKSQAEEMLSKAQALSSTEEEKAAFKEYSERIRYRLDTREIIDKVEYDRRFRPSQAKQVNQ